MQHGLQPFWLRGLFLLSAFALTSCGETQNEEVREAAIRPAKLLTLSAAAEQHAKSYPAVLDAAKKSELGFQVGGLIQTLGVTEAQTIEEGHIIAALDPLDYRAQLASAKSQYEVANEEYERAARLLKENAIARNAYEQRKSSREVAQAALETAEKALADTKLIAPFSGLIAQVPVKKLQRVAPGEVVATLINIERMEVEFNMPASVITHIDNNKTFVRLDALPDTRIEADFKAADLIADATSQTYGITLTFDAPQDLLILPGMTATVEVEFPENDNGQPIARVPVPLAAVVASGDETYVWVVDTDNMTVSKRVISVEPSIGEFLYVSSGLAVGETIVAAGASYLAEGSKVREWEG